MRISLFALALTTVFVASDGHAVDPPSLPPSDDVLIDDFDVEDGPISLHLAVKRFNQQYARFHSSQPPLTVDELVASIRMWGTNPNRTANEREAFSHVAAIAESKELPPSAHLSVVQTSIRNGYVFRGWQIVLSLKTEKELYVNFNVRNTWLASRKERPEERRQSEATQARLREDLQQGGKFPQVVNLTN